MSDLGSIPTPEEISAELTKIRNSPTLKTKKKPMEVLTFIVERKISAGDAVAIDQRDIAAAVWPNKKFELDTSQTFVRSNVTLLRDLLREYYEKYGQDDPVRIELPDVGYVPILRRHVSPAPDIPPPPIPIPPPPETPPALKATTAGWRKPLIAAAVFAAGALLVGIWFSHDRHCGEGMRITSPSEGSAVTGDELVRGTRTPREWYCRCKDFVVVEPVGLRTWYVQDRLLDGAEWSVAAKFGDPSTQAGTRFNVFVLSTTRDLPRGVISPSSDLLAGAKPSRSVEVTLKHTAAWIRIGDTTKLIAARNNQSEMTREELHGTISGTVSTAEAPVLLVYRLVKECFHSKNPPQSPAKGSPIPTCEAKYPTFDRWTAVEAQVEASRNWSASISPQRRSFPTAEMPWLEFWQFQAIAVSRREELTNKVPPWGLVSQAQLAEVHPKQCSESYLFSPLDNGYYRSFWPTVLKSACSI